MYKKSICNLDFIVQPSGGDRSMKARQEEGLAFAPARRQCWLLFFCLKILLFILKIKYSGLFFWVKFKSKSFFIKVYAMSACEAADIAKPNKK